MVSIAVVYHSGYGHTQRQAQALADGAAARLVAIDADGNLPAAGWDELAAADGIVFGAPTYMGGPSWQFKRFADASSKAWYAQAWKDKVFGGFTSSSSPAGDKAGTLDYFFTLAMQHGGLWVGNGMMPSNSKTAQREDPNWHGLWRGAVATTAIDASSGEMSSADLEMARQYGERLAQLTARLAR
ncbi:flavodoxin family protein [Ramlibacter sp. AW1]|uniref:Flavoprotein WrbA n=1 Tax=Ramlibacter aurantiacus TaxID=2801330 RepID=A0A936ZN90_9BURK|nr:flavodoxin family protein [Ramlibacter aurantiacus]MBL0420423.1 flavodoxin family protein [Ramlibacter aurantiacus]